MKKILILIIGIVAMFSGLNFANAATTGVVVVDDYLYVRNMIGGSSIAKLTNGTQVSVTNIDAGSTDSCKAWYKITYGNYNSVGYACGDYITLLKGYASCVENRDPVNIWKDTNKSGKVTSVNCDKEMTILDKDLSSNSKCSDNWYKVKYGNYTGYACSTYVYTNKAVNVVTTYSRPWTSPMKAITGGAEYIAQNYIAKGQYTSYLKKFNVNPDSSYSVYNHQYMANLAAPSGEAKSSYTSYNSNNLLSLPLHFVIPTYKNMPDSTILPGGSAETSGQSNVTDQSFETALDSENFDESYKKKLRALHTKYPNWTFENMKTGLDFNSAVKAEQAVSSISGSSKYYYVDSSGNYVSTEAGWYLANNATVSYYLDPRNFLNENGILMFENLGYSSNYTETIVQSVLDGTFMSGKSNVDNKTYASIFVQVGRSKGVSSVYLASLAKQESGVNGSIATSGNQFTYKGITYKGLYNFFNIGAYSSEESPIKAGLVWASGGDECVIVGNSCNNSSSNNSSNTNNNDSNNSSTNEQVVSNKGSSYYVSKLNVKNNGNYVTGLSVGTTVNTIVSKLTDANSVSVVNVNGQGISGDSKVGTGSVVTVLDKDGKTKYNYTIIMYGDVNGDGNISASDYVNIKNHIMGKKKLSTIALMGADSNKNGSVTASDYVVIKNHIMKKTTISQY